MLRIWNEDQHDGIATRENLLEDLVRNQEWNSCTPLIVELRRNEAQRGTKT